MATSNQHGCNGAWDPSGSRQHQALLWFVSHGRDVARADRQLNKDKIAFMVSGLVWGNLFHRFPKTQATQALLEEQLQREVEEYQVDFQKYQAVTASVHGHQNHYLVNWSPFHTISIGKNPDLSVDSMGFSLVFPWFSPSVGRFSHVLGLGVGVGQGFGLLCGGWASGTANPDLAGTRQGRGRGWIFNVWFLWEFMWILGISGDFLWLNFENSTR